jgi:xanthine dehydrogenase small subunit
MIKFILNDQHVETESHPTTVLLDFIRKEKKLTGTKEGCREGDCGACTVLLGETTGNGLKYKSVNSCLVPLGDVYGKHVVTVEGLNNNGLTPIQEGMVDKGGTQCGFCTPGFVIGMTGYFVNNKNVNVNNAVDSLGGNVCRCTGYGGIKRAVEYAIGFYEQNNSKKKNHLANLVALKYLPEYFLSIEEKLKQIKPASVKAGKKATVLISGGTDLYVQQWENLIKSDAELISSDKKLSGITATKNQISIGAATTIEEVRTSKLLKKYFSTLENDLSLFGSLPIRNRATVGGNIVNASPIGDMANILVALDAELHLVGKKKRSVLLRDFYKGYKSLNIKKSEVIERITFPVPPKGFLFSFEKVSKRTYLDIASVNSTFVCLHSRGRISCIGVSAGGVAPIPFYLNRTCEYLNGKIVSAVVVKYAAQIAMDEVNPISDARGSAEYKRLLFRQLLYAHFLKLFAGKINAEELL